jgi:hypothetical protein
MKRGPGVDDMGNDGGGDGEDVREATLDGGMACITSLLGLLRTTMMLERSQRD